MSEYTTPPLKTITGKNRYCGPAVVSAITGQDTDTISRLIRDRTGRRAVMGTHSGELRATLAALGYAMARQRVLGTPTLAAWLRGREDRKATYLVSVTGHWVVIRGNKFADSATREPVNIRSAPRRRARVRQVFVVRRNDSGDLGAETLRRVRVEDDRRRKARNAMAKARRLAKIHGIEIENMGDGAYNVWPNQALGDADDPFYGDHFCTAGVEVVDRVETYAKIIKQGAAA